MASSRLLVAKGVRPALLELVKTVGGRMSAVANNVKGAPDQRRCTVSGVDRRIWVKPAPRGGFGLERLGLCSLCGTGGCIIERMLERIDTVYEKTAAGSNRHH